MKIKLQQKTDWENKMILNVDINNILNKNLEFNKIDFDIDGVYIVNELSDNLENLINNKIHNLQPNLKFYLSLTYTSEKYIEWLIYHLLKNNNEKTPIILLGLLKYNINLITNSDFCRALGCYYITHNVIQTLIDIDPKCRLYTLFKDVFPGLKENDTMKIINQTIIDLNVDVFTDIINNNNQRVVKSLPGKILKINKCYNPKQLNDIFQSIIEEFKIYYHFVYGVTHNGI